jgi:hypothetical protein
VTERDGCPQRYHVARPCVCGDCGGGVYSRFRATPNKTMSKSQPRDRFGVSVSIVKKSKDLFSME